MRSGVAKGQRKRSGRRRCLIAGVIGVCAIAPACCVAATLTASDATGESSFNTGLHWSDSTAPNASSSYSVGSGLTLRTPADAGNVAFAGSSLTVGDNGAASASLTIKNTANAVITVNSLSLNKGEITNGGNGANAATTVSLGGSGISLGVGGGTFSSGAINRRLNVTSPISGSGKLTIAGGGTVQLSGASFYSGVTAIADGTLRATNPTYSNLLSNAGGVDLGGSGKLLLDYTGSGSPLASVKNAINPGANFTLGQIRATGLNAGKTVGYGDNGVSIVTVRVTLSGDADLDGDVDFNDFLTLQNNYGSPGTRFDQGNFNYDSSTDFYDFLLLQNNFGQSIGFGTVPVTTEERAAVAAFAANLPEPTAALAALFGVVALTRRARI